MLLVHDGTARSHDLFQAVLTMLDPAVPLDLAIAPADALTPGEIQNSIAAEQSRAKQLGRELAVHSIQGDRGPEIVRTARDGRYDLIIVAMPEQWTDTPNRRNGEWISYVLDHAHCPVFLAAPPAIPMEVDENESATTTTRPGH